MTNQEITLVDMEDVLNLLMSWFTVRRARILIWSIAFIEILFVLFVGRHGGGSYFEYIFLPYSAAIVAGAFYATRLPTSDQA